MDDEVQTDGVAPDSIDGVTAESIIDGITAESIISDLVKRQEDDVTFLKAEISEATARMAAWEKDLAIAERRLDVLRNLG